MMLKRITFPEKRYTLTTWDLKIKIEHFAYFHITYGILNIIKIKESKVNLIKKFTSDLLVFLKKYLKKYFIII